MAGSIHAQILMSLHPAYSNAELGFSALWAGVLVKASTACWPVVESRTARFYFEVGALSVYKLSL
ncbi:hypothetical protein LC20_03370 [Yersinia hibernica]|uniref:Uncharacterized protein n=1 Tax=Yersinia enterocolitica LC20 TaxID=1443113 RepID=A0A7U4GGB8_YEREN|nr:hypothetical protein LC20_03370 [Yersinia hibernica]OVZ80825.1 hypothetical protein CBW54_17660 [Yersinia kristensenii]